MNLLDWLARLLAPTDARFNRVELFLRELPGPTLSLLGAALGVALLAYGFAIAGETRAPRRRLMLLRLGAAIILLFIVLGPSLELQQATRLRSRVAVLVDDSRSMSLTEGDGTRSDIARDVAHAASERLGKRFDVEVFRFADELEPLGVDELGNLQAAGRRTDIAGALATLGRDDEDGTLAGVLLVTDGADTARLSDAEDVQRRLREWSPAPVFPVPAADPARLKDLALLDLRYDEFGFVRHELTFEVTLLARGYVGNRVEVLLKQDGAPIATESIVITEGSGRYPIEFPVTPDLPGRFLYSIEARPLPDEAIQTNNRVEFAVDVGRDQLRVLLICGRPSWDERFLRDLLKKDPNVELVSFFILRDREDVPGVPQDELSLIPFPVNDLFTVELENFDLVVLQNLDRRPFLSNLHLENLRSFVVERGGGLMLVGGDMGLAAGGYAGSAIEDILPFRLSWSGTANDDGRFRPGLTDAGERHFITRLDPNLDANREIYAGLPELDGSNVVGPLYPSGYALLSHPTLRAGDEPMPVLATRSVGKGRTLGLTVDTTWYWNFLTVGEGGSNRDYILFWQNAIRWLSRDPASKFLEIRLAERVVEPGAEQEIRVRAFRGDYAGFAGARLRVRVASASRGTAVYEREEVADTTGMLRFTQSHVEEGFYRVTVELIDGRGDVVDRDEQLYEVRPDRTETADPAVRDDLLRAIAGATGGKVLPPSEAADAPVPVRDVYRLEERRRIELWDNGYVYFALLFSLAGEWWLRRRSGLA